MASMDITIPFSKLSTSRGSSRIRLGSSLKNVHAVDKILSFSTLKCAYSVRFMDGSDQWVKKQDINRVLINEFDTRDFVNSFNEGRNTSQGYAFLYLRTSRENPESSHLSQGENSTSIEVQKQELSNLAKRSNLLIQAIGSDTGKSAKDMKNLKGLEFLCDQIAEFNDSEDKDCPRGPVYLYVWNVSRFSRNTTQAVALLDQLTSSGVFVSFKEEGVSYNTAAGRHIVRSALSAAQLHSEATSELVKRVIQIKKSKGEYRVKSKKAFVPYGKMLLQDGSLANNPDEFEIISTAAKLYERVKNATKVAKLLAVKGLKLRRKRISEEMVKSFIQ